MQSRNFEVITVLQDILETYLQGTIGISTSDKSSTSTITTLQANTVMSDNVQVKMLKLLQ